MRIINFLALFFCVTTVAQNYGVLQYKVAAIDSTFLNNELNSKIPEFKLVNYDLLDDNFEIINFNDTIASSEEYKFNVTNMGGTIFNMIILDKSSNKNLFNYKKIAVAETPYDLNVLIDYNNQWQITNETKIINNKKCYKAIINKQKTKTIAWFCPEIPYSYGPKGFCGLPGLIIELTDDMCTIRLDKITFSKEPVLIKLVKKQKQITIEEFNEKFYSRKN